MRMLEEFRSHLILATERKVSLRIHQEFLSEKTDGIHQELTSPCDYTTQNLKKQMTKEFLRSVCHIETIISIRKLYDFAY